MFIKAIVFEFGRLNHVVTFLQEGPYPVQVFFRPGYGIKPSDEDSQFHAKLVDLHETVEIYRGDECSDTMPAFQQAFGFQPGQDTANGCA